MSPTTATGTVETGSPDDHRRTDEHHRRGPARRPALRRTGRADQPAVPARPADGPPGSGRPEWRPAHAHHGSRRPGAPRFPPRDLSGHDEHPRLRRRHLPVSHRYLPDRLLGDRNRGRWRGHPGRLRADLSALFPDPPEPVRISWVWPLIDRPHRLDGRLHIHRQHVAGERRGRWASRPDAPGRRAGRPKCGFRLSSIPTCSTSSRSWRAGSTTCLSAANESREPTLGSPRPG